MTPLTALFFIAVVFRDDPVERHQLVGLGVGLLGVLTVLGVWHGFGSNPWWAVLALLGAVTLYGVSFPYSRRHLTPLGLAPVALASAQLLLAAVTLLPTFLIDGTNGHALTTSGVAGLLGLGVIGSGLAFMWNFRVIQAAGAVHRQHRDVPHAGRRGDRRGHLLARVAHLVRTGRRGDRAAGRRDRPGPAALRASDVAQLTRGHVDVGEELLVALLAHLVTL